MPREDDPRLRRALSQVPHIEFYRYEVSFKLCKGWDEPSKHMGIAYETGLPSNPTPLSDGSFEKVLPAPSLFRRTMKNEKLTRRREECWESPAPCACAWDPEVTWLISWLKLELFRLTPCKEKCVSFMRFGKHDNKKHRFRHVSVWLGWSCLDKSILSRKKIDMSIAGT